MTVKERIAHRAMIKEAKAKEKENWKREEKRKQWAQEKATTTDLFWSPFLTAVDPPPNPQSEHSHRVDGCRLS